MALTTDPGFDEQPIPYQRELALDRSFHDGIEIIFDDGGNPAVGTLTEKELQRSQRTGRHAARGQGVSLRRQLAAGDVIALLACWSALELHPSRPAIGHQLALIAVAVATTLGVMRSAGLYRSRICALRSLEAVRVITATALGVGAYVVTMYLFYHRISAAPAIWAAAASTACVLLVRWRFSRWLKAHRSASRFLRTVVMVGTNDDADELWTLLSEEPELGYRIGAVIGEPAPGSPWMGLPTSTRVDRIGPLAARAGANGVIVVASALGPASRKEAVDKALAAGLHVQVWPGLYGLSARRTRMSPISGVPLLYVEPREVTALQLAVKRAMDVALASALLVVSAPVLLAAAIAVKLTDAGPLIYRSRRVGRYGAPISVLKLRTMMPGAHDIKLDDLNERKGGPLFKASQDPRVTKIGSFLRATSIDEIPQLWNVVRGTMSIVGPRPALPEEVAHFDPELLRRHSMRPGITGLWQVEARDNPSFSAYRRHDLSYVDDWSLGLDVAILASTTYELAIRLVKAVAKPLRRPTTAGSKEIATNERRSTSLAVDEAL